MVDSKNITVLIGGRSYSLTVNAEEEPLIRKVVEELNEKINFYQVTYNRDKVDSLSMALLAISVDFAKYQKNHSNQETIDKVNQLDNLLQKALITNE